MKTRVRVLLGIFLTFLSGPSYAQGSSARNKRRAARVEDKVST